MWAMSPSVPRMEALVAEGARAKVPLEGARDEPLTWTGPPAGLKHSAAQQCTHKIAQLCTSIAQLCTKPLSGAQHGAAWSRKAITGQYGTALVKHQRLSLNSTTHLQTSPLEASGRSLMAVLL